MIEVVVAHICKEKPVEGADIALLMRRKKKQQAQAEPAADPLNELCGGDEELRTALGYFLLHEPQRQIPILGTVNDLIAEAEAALVQGNRMKARIDFETATKIAIYEQDEDSAKKLLTRADEISESELSRKMHQKLLSELGNVMKIAETYYERGTGSKSAEPASQSASVAMHTR
jgi:hypothetical protein